LSRLPNVVFHEANSCHIFLSLRLRWAGLYVVQEMLFKSVHFQGLTGASQLCRGEVVVVRRFARRGAEHAAEAA
jgi:putative methionine-R-sulfoxide reductase with GAF domain